jgi:hypothetical protein
MRKFVRAILRAQLVKLVRALTPKQPPKDYSQENQVLKEMLAVLSPDESFQFARFREMASDLIEARLMCGAGPSMGAPTRTMHLEARNAMMRIEEAAMGLREGTPASAIGAFGDIELALQNVEWRREINLSWLEFSRWGIQQIMLISRLYYVKQPLMRRAIDVIAAYVFGRGVEVKASDDDATDVLNEFFERNRSTFGQTAMLAAQKAKSMDGNLFWVFFADLTDTGKVSARRIDATEIQEIITDPEDSDQEQLFKRTYTAKKFNIANGSTEQVSVTCWYPALGYEKPVGAPDQIGGNVINWDTPMLHRKHGGVAKWHFGCPEGYPALDWIKTGARYMQACATLAASHAQIAWDVTTKGGQAAIEGTKQQLQTQVNAQPGNSLWDTNPTALNASILAKGPGTEWKMVNSRGQGLDPKEGLTYNVYVGDVFGIPPTWLGDMETSNLSTATTLDRPTELGMRARQIEWEDDLGLIATFVLSVSAGAASGKFREALRLRKVGNVIFMQAPRIRKKNGDIVYDEAAKPKADEVHIRVTFPAIREGDLPQIIAAIVASMTLDNKGGQIVGIDEREGVRLLYEALGVEDAEEILREMYPDKATGVKGTPGYEPAYDPSRTKTPLPPPIGRALPNPGGGPQLPGGSPAPGSTAAPPPPGGVPNAPGAQPAQEALISRLSNLVEALKRRRAA